MNNDQPQNSTENKRPIWVKYLLVALVIEKIIQHIFVTTAFYFNWANIRSTVAVNPDILMVLGVIVTILFILSLRGIISQKGWAINLIILLALFDIIGEFVAQGKIGITINVSFLVATILLVLSVYYHGGKIRKT